MNEPKPASEYSPLVFAGEIVRNFLAMLARFGVGLLVLIAFCSLVSQHMKYWEQIELRIPRVSEQLIWFSKWMIRDGWWMSVLIYPPIDFAITLMFTIWMRQKRWLLSAWSHLYFLIAIVLLFWAILGITVPLGNLINPPSELP